MVSGRVIALSSSFARWSADWCVFIHGHAPVVLAVRPAAVAGCALAGSEATTNVTAPAAAPRTSDTVRTLDLLIRIGLVFT